MKHIPFDDYILTCLENFIKKPGNHTIHPSGLQLKEGIEFKPTDIPSRAGTPTALWKSIIIAHLKNNYN